MRVIKRIILVLSLLLLLGASLPELHPVVLRFNGKEVDLRPPILEKEGYFYLPMIAFSELTSLQVTQRSSGEYVLFMDNIFIKFTPNSNTYSLNGKEFAWKNPPFLANDDLYLPQRLLLDFMHFQKNYDKEKRVLDLVSASSHDMTLSRVHNRQRAEFAEAKISYELPFFWKRTSINGFASDQQKSMMIDVKSTPMGEKSLEESITAALAEKKIQNAKKLPVKEQFIRQTTITTHGYLIRHEGGNQYYGFSYFELENQLIETSFVASTPSLDPAIKAEEEILRSVLFKAYTVDSLDEHYVELDAFFDLNVQLHSPLYSNMLTENVLPFSGSIDPRVSEIQATVEKGKQRFVYTIPVKDGKFNASLPIPFGLGFHHINFYLTQNPQESSGYLLRLAEDKNLLLKTSVLNTSMDVALYTSPSDRVPSHHPSLAKINQEIKPSNLDFQKAVTILEFFKAEYEAVEKSTLEESLETKQVDKETAALIYAAHLRNMGVPSRIVSNGSKTFYGVEILSNGIWHLCDPYGYLKNDGLVTKYMSLDPKDFGKRILNYDY